MGDGRSGNRWVSPKNGFDFGWLFDQGQAHNYYPSHLWLNENKFPLAGNVISKHPGSRGRVASEKVTWSHPVMTEQALSFVRGCKDQPFLLHVHWTIPHANNEGGRVYGDGMEVPDYGPYEKRDWKNTSKGQAAMVTWMDRDVGRLLDLLRELKIDHRTLWFHSTMGLIPKEDISTRSSTPMAPARTRSL